MARWAPPELIVAALSGNEAAAEQLITAVWPGCFRLAASVIGDRSLAQDAAQESCVIVYRKVRTVRSADAFDAWLYRIVMRESARARRSRNVAAAAPYDSGYGFDDATTLDVWRALASLTPDFRDVTVLFYFDDLKTLEIAKILGVAHATVRTRLLRSRERLRGLLHDYEDKQRVGRPEITQNAF